MRIRSVKPEFYRDGKLSRLENAFPRLRPMLVFEGLWGCSDKQGVFLFDLDQLRIDILPLIRFDIAKTLCLLERAGLVRRFQADGKIYGHVVNFTRHQRVNGKEAQEESRYPSPSTYLEVPEEATEKQQGSNGEATEKQLRRQEGKGREGKGTKERGGVVSLTSSAEAPRE